MWCGFNNIYRSATVADVVDFWSNNNIDKTLIKTGEPKDGELQLNIYGNGYIERKINATGYKDLSIQYELGYSVSWPMESNDYCGLYIKQNDIKIYINQYYGIDVPGTIQLSYLPKLLDNNDDIYIGFDNNGSDGSDDRIYIPVVIFQGIVTNSSISTHLPTNTPTKYPTDTPAIYPTNTTTFIPSGVPTDTPIIYPTNAPKGTKTNGIFLVYLPWFITGGTVLLCSIIICALIVCGIVCHKQKQKSQESINDAVIVSKFSHNSNINKERNISDCQSMESMYDSNLRISPKTKGKDNYNGQIQDIIQQHLKNNKRKPGEDSLSPKNIKNEGIIVKTIDNYNVSLSNDDIEIITDDNKTTIPGDV